MASDPPTTVVLTIGEIEEGTEQDLLEASSKTTYVLIDKFTARHAVQQVAETSSLFRRLLLKVITGFMVVCKHSNNKTVGNLPRADPSRFPPRLLPRYIYTRLPLIFVQFSRILLS
jgi:hypothetical protein